jgi:hypothetical protein
VRKGRAEEEVAVVEPGVNVILYTNTRMGVGGAYYGFKKIETCILSESRYREKGVPRERAEEEAMMVDWVNLMLLYVRSVKS